MWGKTMQYLSILKKHLLMFTAIVVCFSAITSDGNCLRPKRHRVFPIYQQTKNPNRMNRRTINNIDEKQNRQEQTSNDGTLRTLDQIIDSGYTELNQQNENNNNMNTEEIHNLNTQEKTENNVQISYNNLDENVNNNQSIKHKNYIPESTKSLNNYNSYKNEPVYKPSTVDVGTQTEDMYGSEYMIDNEKSLHFTTSDSNANLDSQNTSTQTVISSNQYGAVPPPPPPPPAPPTIPTIPTVKTSNSEVEGMSLEEEFAQKKNGLKKVEKNNNKVQKISKENEIRLAWEKRQEILKKKGLSHYDFVPKNNDESNDNNKLQPEKNFLQNALTTAIKNKYQNINVGDEENDDWNDNKEQQNYQNENLTNISDNIVNTKNTKQLRDEMLDKRYKNLHMHDDSLFDEDDDNDDW